MGGLRVGGFAAALMAALATGCVFSAGPASADPDFCGAHEDPFACTARLQTGPPTAGESAFINLVRGHVPGGDTQLLVAGRTICSSLSGGDGAQYVDSEVANYLGTNRQSAGQVLDAAVSNICPGVHFS